MHRGIKLPKLSNAGLPSQARDAWIRPCSTPRGERQAVQMGYVGFRDPELAARCYDRAAIAIHGRAATGLNFGPVDYPEVQSPRDIFTYASLTLSKSSTPESSWRGQEHRRKGADLMEYLKHLIDEAREWTAALGPERQSQRGTGEITRVPYARAYLQSFAHEPIKGALHEQSANLKFLLRPQKEARLLEPPIDIEIKPAVLGSLPVHKQHLLTPGKARCLDAQLQQQ